MKDLISEIKSLHSKLKTPAVVFLKGNLGAGKTTFVQEYIDQLGGNKKSVKSPTFSLINRYQVGDQTIFHADLYRISHFDPMLWEELKEILALPEPLLFIEWPDVFEQHIIDFFNGKIYKMEIKFSDQSKRVYKLFDLTST